MIEYTFSIKLINNCSKRFLFLVEMNKVPSTYTGSMKATRRGSFAWDEKSGPVGGDIGNVRRIITSSEKLVIPDAVGPYNQAVQIDRTLYISGQIGLDPSSRESKLVGRERGSKGNVRMEAIQALQNMEGILKAAGASFNNVVKTTVLLVDINDLEDVNEVYKTFFTSKYPARKAYQVAALPKGAWVEIEAVAVVGDITETG